VIPSASGDAAAALLRAVRTMDRLRSPGGCPWDARQTHESLAPYLLEEAYETLDAIAAGDQVALREELGDLLLQVLFHARLAEEGAGPFDVGDVANDLVDKLERRHPHVFGTETGSAGDGALPAQPPSWDEIKKAEKGRQSATDGIALAQPALSLAAKLLSRARRAGVAVDPPRGDDIGARLFALVAEAVDAGIDPELALRAAAQDYREQVRHAERSDGATTQPRGDAPAIEPGPARESGSAATAG
jgi:XTP/dITP diphosphohydrolase